MHKESFAEEGEDKQGVILVSKEVVQVLLEAYHCLALAGLMGLGKLVPGAGKFCQA